MRSRSYSYSPSPSRDYGRRRYSPSPRSHRGGHGRDAPTSLLVRNLRHDCRPDDLRRPFGRFGRLKDVYLPRDYYTGEPRGFGFVQYLDPVDASDAKYHMDGYVLLGRELTVVFAEENRKNPSEMRARERSRGRSSGLSSRGYSRSPGYTRGRSRTPRYSRGYSPSPGYSQGYSQSRSYSRENSRSPGYYSRSSRRRYSRSISPRDIRYKRHPQGYSRSPYGKRSQSRSLSPGYSR